MALAELARDPFAAASHDHGQCVRKAVEQAFELCRRRGVRLTEVRREVLELIWQSHAPIGAYQLLEQLATSRGRVAPPTIYRALDFLAREGLVHRIDSLTAYVGCASPSSPHDAYFLICSDCGDAAEFHDGDLAAIVARCATRSGFAIEATSVELTGRCARCNVAAANRGLAAVAHGR